MKVRSRRKRALFWAAYLALLGGTPYLAGVVWRTNILYRDVKGAQRGLKGKLYRGHRELGFAPIPGAQGRWRVAHGLEVPVRFDDDGFRVPVEDPGAQAGRRPRMLALGCSFTAGAGCLAQDVYPFLVAEALGGEAKNAAVSGYGLAQMLLLARELIPRHGPDYVLVQYADWLVERSRTHIAPSLLGRVPSPYFYRSEDGRFLVQRPVFSTALFALPVWKYANGRWGAGEYLSFFVQVGLPLYLHEDVTLSLKGLRELAGSVPAPALDGTEVVRTAYGEMAALSEGSGARMIVVIAGKASAPATRVLLEELDGVLVVDIQAALWRELNADRPGAAAATMDDYLKAYGHWFGSPPRLVDWHPNPRAHAIIAREIVGAIRGQLRPAAQAGSPGPDSVRSVTE